MQIRNYFYSRRHPSVRCLRLAKHCRLQVLRPVRNTTAIPWWWFTLLVLILDLIGLDELYQLLAKFIKPNTRSLMENEKILARSIFGETIRLDRVRIDEHAWLGPRQSRFCYVSGYIINSWGSMHEALLIHELVHVWQYERLGSVYIPLALKAQHSKEGYDYGGVQALQQALATGRDLLDFNLEQQADIVADYFCLLHGRPTRWSRAHKPEIGVYQKILKGPM